MRWLKRLFLFIFFLAVIFAIVAFIQLRDRHPGYTIDLTAVAKDPAPLKVGFSAMTINPKLTDTWKDANEDGRYVPEDGDTYTDVNNNGKFDAIWMAGFDNSRPANGIHDNLWARAMIIDDGNFRLALVVLDAIGFGADDVIDVRKGIELSAGIDYAIICATHTHEAPDLIGLWGGSGYKSGVNKAYLNYVKHQAARVVELAAEGLRPAKIRFAEDLTSAESMVDDTRKPIVKDSGVRILQAIDIETDRTLGTLVSWGNHPETLWRKNLDITSDFPHYLRNAMEDGVMDGDQLLKEGLGGTAIFVPAAIGGLMTTHDGMGIRSVSGNKILKEPSFAKAKAQGHRLALIALNALEGESAVTIDRGAISLRAKTLKIPLDNWTLTAGALLGILDRGLAGWQKLRTEICVWQLGPASFLHQPGEIYPEIVNGGVEAPEGQDFKIEPIETPPLRSLMPGQFKFVVGLSNDMLGYIIPKSEWDQEPPYIYGETEETYGEVVSPGPETAPILYRATVDLLEEL